MLFAEIVPIMIMVIASIMMIEAAGSVDETTMTRLEGLKTHFLGTQAMLGAPSSMILQD